MSADKKSMLPLAQPLFPLFLLLSLSRSLSLSVCLSACLPVRPSVCLTACMDKMKSFYINVDLMLEWNSISTSLSFIRFWIFPGDLFFDRLTHPSTKTILVKLEKNNHIGICNPLGQRWRTYGTHAQKRHARRFHVARHALEIYQEIIAEYFIFKRLQ